MLLTRWRDTIMFSGVVVSAGMGGRQKVLAAERFCTVLTLEWEKIHEVASRVGALLPNVE